MLFEAAECGEGCSPRLVGKALDTDDLILIYLISFSNPSLNNFSFNANLLFFK